MPIVYLLTPVRGAEGRSEKRIAREHAIRGAAAWMARRWPRAFPAADPPPLVVGIRAAILAAAGTDPGAPTPATVAYALAAWRRTGPYLHALAKGRARVDLAGEPAGTVTPEQREHARGLLKHRRAARVARQAAPAPAPAPPPRPPAVGVRRPVLTLRRASA